MYIFLYVPVTGNIFPARTRNRVGSLRMRSPSRGGQDRTCSEQDRLGPPTIAMEVSPCNVGTQRTWRYDRRHYISIDTDTFLFVQQLCIYFCFYLSQAISFPPALGIESDLFGRVHRLSCNIMLVPSPVELLYSRNERRGDPAPRHRRVLAPSLTLKLAPSAAPTSAPSKVPTSHQCPCCSTSGSLMVAPTGGLSCFPSVQEVELEPAEISCCVVVPLSPAATLLSRHVP